MATVASPPRAETQRLLLHDVSWETYESLMADHASQSTPRFAYDRGKLEIAMPSPEHDGAALLLETVVSIAVEEWDTKIYGLRSTTFRRKDLDRGFEPDGAYYVAHAAQMDGKKVIDLTVDPPPDLVIEVDVTRSSLDKVAHFAAFGVPEVWRESGGQVTIHRLGPVGYALSAQSGAFSPLSAADLTRFLAERAATDHPAWMRGVRAWVRAQRPPAGPIG